MVVVLVAGSDGAVMRQLKQVGEERSGAGAGGRQGPAAQAMEVFLALRAQERQPVLS